MAAEEALKILSEHGLIIEISNSLELPGRWRATRELPPI
jgi:hypothetical protein